MSEFDYLGKEDSDLARDDGEKEKCQEDQEESMRKSLEKDFDVAAEEDATEAESPSPNKVSFANEQAEDDIP